VRCTALLLAAGADPNTAAAPERPALSWLLLAAGARAPSEPRLAKQKDDAVVIRRELSRLAGEADPFVERTTDPACFRGPLTPLLGDVNRMVVLLTNFATGIEQRVRKLRTQRLRELAEQFAWVAASERAVVGEARAADGRAWAEALADVKRKLGNLPGDWPDIPDAPAEEAAVPKPADDEGERRQRLLMLNTELSGYRKALTRSYEYASKLAGHIAKVLDGLEATLAEMVRLVVTQQQMNLEFEKVHTKASVSSQAAGVLHDRKEVLTLDRALISWEKERFADVSAKVLRLLRYCAV
jgi:hypothetical protein